MANHLKEKRIASGMSQGEIAQAMYGSSNHTVVSLLESGRCLPNPEGMKTLCDLFKCKPSDLFDPEMLTVFTDEKPAAQPLPEKPGDALVQLRVWIKQDEKKALEKALSQLGYPSTAEWLREQMRIVHERCRQLELTGEATVAEQLVSTNIV